MDARFAQIGDVLQVAIDHAVAIGKSQRHGRHIVQLIVLQAINLESALFELLAHSLVGLGVVLRHVGDHDPIHAHLLEKADALLIKVVAAVLTQRDFALHLGADLDARTLIVIARNGLHGNRHVLYPPVF